jgi:hypothetical protein
MYNLFLDDVRKPSCLGLVLTWEVVRNYDQFVKIITEKGLPGFISFDHDLCWEDINKDPFSEGFKEQTGADCARWLVEYCMGKGNLPLPKWQIHSMNDGGRMAIKSILTSYEKFIQADTEKN